MFLQIFNKYTMDNNLDKVAEDLYGKIQTRFPEIKIGDENAEVLSKKSDIPNARFFEFEYEEGGAPLGTIAITLDEDDGIVIQVSGDLSEDTTSTYHDAYKFIRSFRKFAKNRLLNFDVQNIGKSNLDKRDYQFQAKTKEMPMPERMAAPAHKPQVLPKESQMMESKMFGTSRISYQDLGEARLIVKHTQPINQDFAAGRSQHIKGIYIENADGERFKYPYKHLHGARALAEHIKHGGNPYDAIGKHITSLSEELNQLRKFKGYVTRQSQISEAMGSVTGKVLERIEAVKKEVHNLQRGSYYEQFAESFTESEERIIPEDIMNDWVDRLTVRTFNEELTSAFPYLYKLISEDELPIKELSADDFLDEAFGKAGLSASLKKQGFGDSEYWEKGAKEKEARHTKADTEMEQRAKEWKEKFGKKDESFTPELTLEKFLENIVSPFVDKGYLFSENPAARNQAINDFNDMASTEFVGGEAGVLALSKDNLMTDPAILDKIRVLDTDEEIRQEIHDYIVDTDPDLLPSLPGLATENPEEIGGADVEPVAPSAPAAELPPAPAAELPPEGVPPEGAVPPAVPPEGLPPEGMPPLGTPPAPIAESTSKSAKMKAKFIKAKTAGATLDTPFAEGMTVRDAIRECGLAPSACGFSDEEEPTESGIDQLLKTIVGFWNRTARNFTIGGTRAKIKVAKAFEDGECPNATEHDVKRVLVMISKKDPSSEENDQQQHDVLRLAGVRKEPTSDSRQDSLLNNIKIMQEQPISEGILAQIKKNAGLL
jgi:hypothetical protein